MSAEISLAKPFELPAGIFRPALFSLDDLPEIFAIEESSHPHPWRLDNFRSSLSSHTCIGLQFENRWVAYGILSFVVGEAELLLFVVDKAWRGRGVGSRFLTELLNLARQRAETIFLEVRESNQAAIALYEKLGFNLVGVRPNYYPAPSSLVGSARRGGREDALLYALDLTCLQDGDP